MYGSQQTWQQQPPPPQGQHPNLPPPVSSTSSGIMNGNYDQVSNLVNKMLIGQTLKIGRDFTYHVMCVFSYNLRWRL